MNVFTQNTDNISKAKLFVELLGKKDFQTAETYFNDQVKAQLSAAKLAEVLNSLTPQVGNFKDQTEVKTDKINELEIVVITVEYEKANLDFQMSFDKNGKIGGFFFRPSQTPNKNAEAYKAPEYVRPNAFQEKELTIGAGTEWTLPATLTMPVGKGNFPVTVLVHGSGANDRDESHINPANKPFKDLAWGLASKGIAVLRYEKRTKQYPKQTTQIKNPTVNDETIDDALAAVELLRKTPQMDPKKIYVLGHSLGGYLIPRIAARDAKIAGFVSLAGTTRPLEDVILEQNIYFARLDGTVSKDEQVKLEQLKQISAQIKLLKESDRDSSADYLGIPASYWIDLKNYNPPLESKSLKRPILILQGERDYQVTMTDFQNWKTALGTKKSVTFKTYAKLNHLFMPGEGTPSPADYEKTNHVSHEVISDIATWISGQK
jgi:dienelactone hydrolase